MPKKERYNKYTILSKQSGGIIMSSYKDFSRCVICRSKQNLCAYQGEFEITFLLNTLYLVVMYPLEHRKNLHVKPKQIVDKLEALNTVNKCGNELNPDDIVRYLRNGLAHFNLKVDNGNCKDGNIQQIEIWAKNLPDKPKCKTPCEDPKCLPPQYNELNGAICKFIFSVSTLKQFTEYMIELLLNTLDGSACKDCKYQCHNPKE